MPWSMPLPPMQPLSEDIDARICRGGDEATAAVREYAAECKARGKSLVTLAKQLVPVWIPVEERLPERNEIVLVTDQDGVTVGSYSPMLDDWWTLHGDRMAPGADVSHWMPLPEPPEVQ